MRGPFLYEFESPSPNDDLCQGSDLGFEQTLKFPAQECFVTSLPVVKICPMVLEKTFENCQCVKVFAFFVVAFYLSLPFFPKENLRVLCVKFGLDLNWSFKSRSRSFWLRAAFERCIWKITQALFQWRSSMYKNGRGLPNDLMALPRQMKEKHVKWTA